jgi:predicted AAA+ superfamily ATPase
VREVSLVEQLVDLLQGRVGSPLSVANLAGDLEVDHKTVEHWSASS